MGPNFSLPSKGVLRASIQVKPRNFGLILDSLAQINFEISVVEKCELQCPIPLSLSLVAEDNSTDVLTPNMG